MATKYNFLLFKKQHKFFNYCHTDTGAHYSDLNLNQNLKGFKIFPFQSNSKSYNNKKIDCTLSESYEEKEKSQTWKRKDLCSKYTNNLSLNDETEKCWKKNGSSNATNNSTLSLRISAYENSNEVSSDSLNKSFQKSVLIQKQKQINLASKFVPQSPFEFQRQRNDKVPEPEVSQFKASQRLLNVSKSGLHSNTAAIAAESRRASSTAAFDLLKRNKMADSQYQIVERGSLHSLDYRIFFKGPNGFISPWHDIPLFADESKKIYNMIVEIPRWTNAKMEMATKEPLTPIKQDEKKGLPRFVNNIFPHRGYIWNYGALPQTWEDPNHLDSNTNAKGDNDPIDVIEIGSQIQNRGAVVQVKILGTLALLDEGETDWKLVAIAASDPLFDKVNHINDVEEHFPGLLKATEEWFRIYKIPTGKPANEIAFNGEFKDAEFANEIIAETHQFWKNLIKETSPKLNTEAHVEGAAFIANDEEWKKAVETSPPLSDPKEAPADNDKWHFIRLP